MESEVDWEKVLGKIFSEYGSQLRRAKVKKLAAKVARQQGAKEEKRDLKTLLKRFLGSEEGKKAIHDNDGMLSLVAKTSAAPTQPSRFKLSLLDLAEAADVLSRTQSGSKQAQQSGRPQTHLAGPRSGTKRKAGDLEDASDHAAAVSPTMLTRAQLRQQGSNLYEAVMAADATALPPLLPPASPLAQNGQSPAKKPAMQSSMASDRPASAHKQAEQTVKSSAELRTGTLLPNGEVLAHLPLSQRGQQQVLPEPAMPADANQHKQLAKTIKGKGKAAAADGAAATTTNTATLAPDAAITADTAVKTAADAPAALAGGNSTVEATTGVNKLQQGAADQPAAKKKKRDKHQGSATATEASLSGAPAPAALPVPQSAVATNGAAADKKKHKHRRDKDKQSQAALPEAVALPGNAVSGPAANLQQPVALPAGGAQQGSAPAQQDITMASIQPAKKQKKHKRERAEAKAAGAAPADAPPTKQDTAAQPSTTISNVVSAAAAHDVAPAQPQPQDQVADGGVLQAKKAKKHKHRSKDALVTAETPATAHGDSANAITAAATAAALPVASSSPADPTVAKPHFPSPATAATGTKDVPAAKSKKHKRKHKEKKHAKALSKEQAAASADPVAMWPSAHAVPAELEDPTEPAVPAELDDPAEPAMPAEPAISKHKKRKSKAANALDVPSEGAEPPEPVRKRKKRKSKPSEHAGQEPNSPADKQMLPETADTAPAEQAAAAQTASAAQMPASQAKHGRKTKAGKVAEADAASAEDTLGSKGTASKPNPSSESTADRTAELEAASTEELAVAGEVPPKTKRGRKPKASKAAEPEAAGLEEVAAAGETAPKAKRGRKPKASKVSEAEAAGIEPSTSAGRANKARPQSQASADEAAAATSGPVSWREDQARTDVKKGKFSKQEKETLKQSAQSYAQEHGLPSEDFSWLFNTRTGGHKKEAAGAWQNIAQSLPHRTYKSVYACGTRMLHELNYQGKWSKEEDELLRELVTDRGPQWKDFGIILGRLPEGCRDRWRDIKLGSSKKAGKWNEEESEKLRLLVSDYLAVKQGHEGGPQADGALSLTEDDLLVGPSEGHGKQADGRIILDDIDWDVISSRHGARSAPQCLTKWYTQLAPSMVSKGDWGSGDDRRLLRALLRTGAVHEFQVDWGNLIARNAAQTRRRWRLMLKCVKNATDQEFHENLLSLIQSFTPDLLPPEEATSDANQAGHADNA